MKLVHTSAVNTRQQQTSFIIINDTTVKLISLKYKKKYHAQKCRINETVLLGTQKYKTMVAYIATVVERKYFTCPSRESNQGRWIYRQTLYHVAVKAGFYRKAVEVYFIYLDPVTFTPSNLKFVPEFLGTGIT